MKRRILFALASVVVLLIAIAAYFIATFEMFDVILVEIATIEVPDKNYEFGLFYFAGNATAESSVQIWRFEGSAPTILRSFERYDSLVSYDLVDDSLLALVLVDVDASGMKPDTVVVNVNISGDAR